MSDISIEEMKKLYTPMKVIRERYGRIRDDFFNCPRCKRMVGYCKKRGEGPVKIDNFCSNCGQRIDTTQIPKEVDIYYTKCEGKGWVQKNE